MVKKIFSYSLSGNNTLLAESIAKNLNINHIIIKEDKPRSIWKTAFDMLFNRTPEIIISEDYKDSGELTIFIAPIWMGKIASPIKALIKKIKTNIDNYIFISISGGADGPNSKIKDELVKLTGKNPVAVINPLLASLPVWEFRPKRKHTMDYKLNIEDVKHITTEVISKLKEID